MTSYIRAFGYRLSIAGATAVLAGAALAYVFGEVGALASLPVGIGLGIWAALGTSFESL